MDFLAGLSMLSWTNNHYVNQYVAGVYGNQANGDAQTVSGSKETSEEKSLIGRPQKYDGFGEKECQTCANRRYQDGSNDSGVSFQTPTKLSPDEAASAVRSHEMEHVTRNQAKARREGKEIVSQSVTIHMAKCPECGESYVSGGVTHTVTRGEKKYDFGVGLQNDPRGSLLNATA